MQLVTYLKISVILGMHLKQIIFAKFLAILLDINIAYQRTQIRLQSNNHSDAIWVYIFRFFTKGTMFSKCF